MAVALMGMLALTGCQGSDGTTVGPEPVPNATVVDEVSQTQAFRVTQVKSPRRGKHSHPFRVWLQSVDDGHAYPRVRVARRCYGWRQVKVGSVVRLNEVTRHYSDGTVNRRIANIETVCPGKG